MIKTLTIKYGEFLIHRKVMTLKCSDETAARVMKFYADDDLNELRDALTGPDVSILNTESISIDETNVAEVEDIEIEAVN